MLFLPNTDECLQQGTYYVKVCPTFIQIMTAFWKINDYGSVYQWQLKKYGPTIIVVKFIPTTDKITCLTRVNYTRCYNSNILQTKYIHGQTVHICV